VELTVTVDNTGPDGDEVVHCMPAIPCQCDPTDHPAHRVRPGCHWRGASANVSFLYMPTGCSFTGRGLERIVEPGEVSSGSARRATLAGRSLCSWSGPLGRFAVSGSWKSDHRHPAALGSA